MSFSCSAPDGLLLAVWLVALLLFLYHFTFPKKQRRRVRREAVGLHLGLFLVMALLDAAGRRIEWGCTIDLLVAPLKVLGGGL